MFTKLSIYRDVASNVAQKGWLDTADKEYQNIISISLCDL